MTDFNSAGELFDWLNQSHLNVIYHQKARNRIYKGKFQAKGLKETSWEDDDGALTRTLATFKEARKCSSTATRIDDLLDEICEDVCTGDQIRELITIIIDRLPPEAIKTTEKKKTAKRKAK